MMRWPEMPLLGKELTELAAKKRTWVFRVVAVLGVMVAFLAGWVEIMLSSDGFHRPGIGHEIFQFIVGGLYGVLFVFIPLAMCGTVAGERERGTLDILLLTHQSPWRIIWQKYLGHLIPFFTLLLAAMPMMAICYALGGLSRSDITVAAVLLIVTCLQLGALTMVGSALCRSTAMAFFTSLAVGFFYYCVPQVVVAICDALIWGYMRPDLAWGVWFLPQNHFSWQGTCNWGFVTVPVSVSWIPAAMTLPLLLGVARFYLERDAQAQVVRLVRAFLARLQNRIRPSIKSGVLKIFGRFKPSNLPEDEPISWRETSRVFYGRKDVMVGLAVVLAIMPTASMCIWTFHILANPRSFVDYKNEIAGKLIGFMVFEIWAWAICAGLLLFRGVTAFLTDRMRQTLPVLMTTPMTGRDIVLQKMKGICGLMFALAVPLVIIMAMRLAAISLTGTDELTKLMVLIVGMLSCMLIYGPMFAWIGLWMGLRFRKFLVAMIVAVIAIGAWIFGTLFPLAALMFTGIISDNSPPIVILPWLANPAVAVIALILGGVAEVWLPTSHFLIVVIINSAIHGTILIAVRWWVLRNADRWLGRAS